MKKDQPRIIYEDGDLVGIDKPSGWLSIPARHRPERDNVYDWLHSRYDAIFTVHRLDKDTSGLMIFARTEAAHKSLNTAFQERETDKRYIAFVLGRPYPDEGTIELALTRMKNAPYKTIPDKEGKPSLTKYFLEMAFGHYAKLSVRIETGRTHQIRAHLSAVGHPLMVDSLYGGGEAFYLSSVKKNYKSGRGKEERPLLDRLSLHAHTLSIAHPSSGECLHLNSEMPKDLRAVERQLSKWDPYPSN